MQRFAPIFQWYAFHTAPYLQLFRVYVASLEENIERAAAEYAAGVQLVPSPTESGTEWVAQYAGLSEGEWSLSEVFDRHFPNLQRQSAFTALMSVVERDFNGLCSRVRVIKNLELEFKDISGKGIVRARDYLKKVARIPTWDETPQWVTLRQFIALRNFIVHEGSPKMESALRTFIDRRPDADFSHGEVVFSKDFLVNALGNVESYYSLLAQGLHTWCQQESLKERQSRA